jgi:1-aminocyclopropane-1-carboxylate deaminase/D-cysteine desulfhydrase-like pyridoxal-dependent ACC family enzyme
MKWYHELKAEGIKPYALPLGGSTPLGTLGYVKAMEELSGQLSDDNVQIFCPVGSCGTLAGTVLGSALFMPNAKVYGISVSRTKEDIYKRTRELIKESAKLINADQELSKTEFFVYDCYHEEYAKHIKIAMDAAAVCAKLEGIIVDQVYTGKAMAGLFDLAFKGVLNKENPVIFLHTGGMPEVFSDTLKFGEYKKCWKYSVEEVQELKKS